jgi:hypothetical protein
MEDRKKNHVEKEMTLFFTHIVSRGENWNQHENVKLFYFIFIDDKCKNANCIPQRWRKMSDYQFSVLSGETWDLIGQIVR